MTHYSKIKHFFHSYYSVNQYLLIRNWFRLCILERGGGGDFKIYGATKSYGPVIYGESQVYVAYIFELLPGLMWEGTGVRYGRGIYWIPSYFGWFVSRGHVSAYERVEWSVELSVHVTDRIHYQQKLQDLMRYWWGQFNFLVHSVHT